MSFTFTSISFLIALAVFLVLYGFCPARYRKYLLLVGSVAFVAANSWQAALFALGFAVANYVMGICIQYTRYHKLTLGFAVATNAVAMIGFKLLNVNVLGMSYYLFSFMAYLVEIYRQSLAPELDPVRFASFAYFFPKFTQGPITRYEEMKDQLEKPTYRLSGIQQGLEYFIIGFSMKILLVDKLNLLFQTKANGEPGYHNLITTGYEFISTKLAWLAAVDVSLHIFLEWQAYMFMALGIAAALGYKLPQNFNYPYTARSIGDYYRRWHMTLTRWFKDYIYIPLGGSRKGLLRTVANILMVWLVTSLWHGNGLSPKYVIWGLIAGGAIVYDPIWYRRINGVSADDRDNPERVSLGYQLLGHIWLLLLIPISVLILWKPSSGVNFILWGMTIGVLIVIEKLWKQFVVDRFKIGERIGKNRILGIIWKVFVSILAHIWVIIPILVTWVMFHISDYSELKVFLSRLFPKHGQAKGFIPNDFDIRWKGKDYYLGNYTLIGILFCFPLPKMIYQWFRNHTVGKKRFRLGSWIVSILLAALFWYAVYTLKQRGGSDPMGYAGF